MHKQPEQILQQYTATNIAAAAAAEAVILWKIGDDVRIRKMCSVTFCSPFGFVCEGSLNLFALERKHDTNEILQIIEFIIPVLFESEEYCLNNLFTLLN